MAYLTALALALLPVSVDAAPAAPSFEQTLGRGLREVLDVRQAQAASNIRLRLVRLSFDARDAASEARRLRMTTSDVSRRARRHDPTDPSRQDPLLKGDARRLASDLAAHARRASWLSSEARSLALGAQKDPDAVAAATTLTFDAQQWRNDAQALSQEGRSAMWDLRTAGLGFEGADIERSASAAAGEARDTSSFASQILFKVR